MSRFSPKRTRRTHHPRPTLEPLDPRLLLAVTASFAEGTLRVTGDDLDNAITVSRDPAGNLLVNNGAVPVLGGTPNVANTAHLHLVGAGGNDSLTLDETNGPLPGAALFGGAGNDTLTGGSGIDFAAGESGADTASLGAGNDTFAWNPGDGSDVVDGQAGTDELVFNGSDLDELFTLDDTGAGAAFHQARLTRNVGNVALDLARLETININPLAGADTVTLNDQTATDVFTVNVDLQGPGGAGDGSPDAVVLNGSEGADVAQVASFADRVTANATLFPFVNITGAEPATDRLTLNTLGGNDTVDASALAPNLIALALNTGAGNDEIFASPGDDQVTPGPGNDTAFLDAGDDTLTWNAGDGNDSVDGQVGTDTFNFNGAVTADHITLAASGARARLTDDTGNVTTDTDNIEQIAIAPLGGPDTVTVNDLAATAVTHVKIKLAADAQPDHITLNATGDADTITVEGTFANGVHVTGLAAQVDVLGVIAPDESLTVNGLGGVDAINAATTDADAITLTLVGGAANDRLTGGQGDDTFPWNPGDGSDSIEGQAGNDRLLFNGSDVAEQFTLSAAANRARLTRDVGSIAMDLNDVEAVTLNPLGGADTITVDDLTPTDVTALDLNLDGPAGDGFGDNAADAFILNATNANDAVQIVSVGPRIVIAGLFPFINITGEGGLDTLTLNTGAGNDSVDAANLAATNATQLITLTLAGGAGNDTLTGSQGADTFVWNPGDGSDTIDGRENPDTFVFNGSDAPEQFALSAVATHARLTRDLDAVTTDLAAVESITVNARGGADTLTVNDLTGTPVGRIDANLAATPDTTTGDAQPDSITVNGRNIADTIPVVGLIGGLLVNGGFADGASLPYFLFIRAVEAADALRINGNSGADTIEADLSIPVNLTIDAGAQHDSIRVDATTPGSPVTLLPSPGDDDLTIDNDGADPAAVLLPAAHRLGALTIANRGLLTLAPGGGNALTVTALNITHTARLDVKDNAIIVDYTAASPIAAIQQLLRTGYNAGAWNGPGLMTSLGDPATFALGFAEAADVAPAAGTFLGQPVDNTSIVIRRTLYGDATLDGEVDFNDLVRLAQGLNTPLTTPHGSWFQGDFTYDDAADFADLVKLAQDYNTALPASPAAAPQTSMRSTRTEGALHSRPRHRDNPYTRLL